MRKGEQDSLEWPAAEVKHKQIHVKESKNGTERYILMLPEVAWAFKTLKSLGLKRKDRAEAQPNESAAECCFALADSKKWRATVLREAKVRKYRWHDNRHTFCSRLAQAKPQSCTRLGEASGYQDDGTICPFGSGTKRKALKDAFKVG
jgi:hypothetical protein